jgi:hypothetical protein
MNERDKELYKEATGKEWAYDFDPMIAEKFADLIRADQKKIDAKICADDESGRDSGGFYADLIRARGSNA